MGGRSNSQRRQELRGGRRSGKGEREGVWRAVTSPSSWSARSPTSWGRRMREGGEGNRGVAVYLCRVVSTPRTVRRRSAGTPLCVSLRHAARRDDDASTPSSHLPTTSPRLFHESVSLPGRACYRQRNRPPGPAYPAPTRIRACFARGVETPKGIQ